MQVWSVPSTATSAVAAARGVAHEPPAGWDLGGLIDCIARDDFAPRALAALNRALPLAWWTVTRVDAGRPPRLSLQASHGVPDIALDCWQIYRSGVYREDAPFAEACERVSNAAGRAVVTRCTADDFGPAHRERIYVAHSLSERMSLVSADRRDEFDIDGPGPVLAINFYRHRAQPRFDPAEIDTVLELAGPLIALVRRHLQLSEPLPAPGDPLRALCGDLTPRELEVCHGLLRGLSFEGIAADLGLKTTTVKTYRNRAFERLHIHHRNELFGLLWQGRPNRAPCHSGT